MYKMQRDLIINKLSSNTLTLQDFDRRDSFTNNIIQKLHLQYHELGYKKGIVGKVYLIDNQLVVKKIKPCNHATLDQFCLDIEKLYFEPIDVIPGGNNKLRYVLPNLLSEIVIGMVIDDPGFATTIASMILKESEEISIYIIMKQLEPVIDNERINPKLGLSNAYAFLTFLFQVCFVLLQTQKLYKFTHYDLHVENLLFSTREKDLVYPSDPMVTIGHNFPFTIKLADFSSSRMEINNAIVAPTVDEKPIKNYGEFNYNYDFMCFMGSMLMFDKHRKAFAKLFNDKSILQYVLTMMLWFLKDPMTVNSKMTMKQLEDVRMYIARKYYRKNKVGYSYRPKQKGAYITYLNTKSMIDVVNYLAVTLSQITPKASLTRDAVVLKNMNPYPRYDQIVLFKDTETTVSMGPIEIKKTNYIINQAPPEYNLTITAAQLKRCPRQHQFITTARVPRGAKFFTDCCKLDPVNYLLQHPSRRGVVVNGAFFSYKADFLPIGRYSDEHNEIDRHGIPFGYADQYSNVILGRTGLRISSRVRDDEELYFAAGPVLIKNFEIVFNPDDARFMCTEKKFAKDLMTHEDEEDITVSGHWKYESAKGNKCTKKKVSKVETLKRCDKIDPGSFNHADNANPRTVLCILENGDYLIVCVEGRGEDGDGMDLYSLAVLLLKEYKIKDCINLDGGRSSTLVWRDKPGSVYYSSPFHNHYYPSGFILGTYI